MKGGQKGILKGSRVKVDYGTGPAVEGSVFQSTAKGNPENTTLYKVTWDDKRISGWIPEDKVTELTGNPPEPSGQGRKTRKHKRKTSKRKKTNRR